MAINFQKGKEGEEKENRNLLLFVSAPFISSSKISLGGKRTRAKQQTTQVVPDVIFDINSRLSLVYIVYSHPIVSHILGLPQHNGAEPFARQQLCHQHKLYKRICFLPFRLLLLLIIPAGRQVYHFQISGGCIAAPVIALVTRQDMKRAGVLHRSSSPWEVPPPAVSLLSPVVQAEQSSCIPTAQLPTPISSVSRLQSPFITSNSNR